jgi:hypothetical protein
MCDHPSSVHVIFVFLPQRPEVETTYHIFVLEEQPHAAAYQRPGRQNRIEMDDPIVLMPACISAHNKIIFARTSPSLRILIVWYNSPVVPQSFSRRLSPYSNISIPSLSSLVPALACLLLRLVLASNSTWAAKPTSTPMRMYFIFMWSWFT